MEERTKIIKERHAKPGGRCMERNVVYQYIKANIVFMQMYVMHVYHLYMGSFLAKREKIDY